MYSVPVFNEMEKCRYIAVQTTKYITIFASKKCRLHLQVVTILRGAGTYSGYHLLACNFRLK